MKTTDQTLSDQQLFLLAHRRHHHFVHFARIFMLLLFLTVWELFADFHIIDSFFQSFPCRRLLCPHGLRAFPVYPYRYHVD